MRASTIARPYLAITRRGLDSSFPDDIQFDRPSFSWLLGRVGFVAAPGSRAELFFGIGNQGFLFVNAVGSDAVYFGWGDTYLRAHHFGLESALPDAFIVPEPGGSSLLLLGAAALARRRASRPVGRPDPRFLRDAASIADLANRAPRVVIGLSRSREATVVVDVPRSGTPLYTPTP